MSNIKASLVISSHLSDIQELINDESESAKNEMTNRLNFIKHLVIAFPNTNTVIDADYQYRIFKKLYSHLIK
jgi:hypothetical protein